MMGRVDGFGNVTGVVLLNFCHFVCFMFCIAETNDANAARALVDAHAARPIVDANAARAIVAPPVR